MASSAKRVDAIRSEVSPDIKGVVGDSWGVACGILASRITGFGRIAAAAAVLGPTFFGNLFQTVAVLPGTLYSLLIGTLISAVLVPPLVRRMSDSGLDGVRSFAGTVLGIMLLLLLSIGLLIVIAAPVLLRALTVTVTDPEIQRQQMRVGVPLLIMVMPQIALYGIAGTGMAVQQACGRFVLPAAAPALENLVNIGVLGCSALLFGIGSDISQIGVPQLLVLGIGTTGAVAVHAVMQWIGAYRVGVPLLPRLDWSDSGIRQILRRGVNSMGYTALYWGANLMMLVIAGTLPGGVAAFQIASSFCTFPVALTAVSLAAAQLPRLAASHQRHEMQVFRCVYESGLRLLMFLTVPAGLILVALPRVLAGAAAFGAMNSPSGITLIAGCLEGLGIGVTGEAVFMLSTSTLYVRHDTTAPLRAMGLRLTIAGVGGVVAWLLVPGGEMMLVLGASVAAANLAAGYYLWRRLRCGLPPSTAKGTGLTSALVVSVFALIPAMLLTNRFDGSTHLASYDRMWFALGMLGLTVATYFTIQFARGSHELHLLLPVSAARWTARMRPRGV